MEINFPLNDRQNCDQLSDHIINSAQDLFDQLLKDGYVQDFLLKGELNDRNIKVAHRRQKDAIGYVRDEYMIQTLKNLIELTEFEGEKQFIAKCIEGIELKFQEYSKVFNKQFGKPSDELLNSPMTQPNYGYHIHQLFHSSPDTGSLLRGIAAILSGLFVCYRTLDYLKQNPNYSPNTLAVYLCYEYFDMKTMTKEFRAMIDRRGDNVTSDERKILCNIFRRSVAFERLIENHNYYLKQWFGG